MKDFWLSCGHHLLDRDKRGWLCLTDEFMKVYLARPELVPPPEACGAERRLHAALLSAASGTAPASSGSGPAVRPPDPPDGLTNREVEILTLIVQGLTNPEIAERLFLSNHTIKTHINRIFAKTGSRDRVAAITYAQRHGIGADAPLRSD